MKRVLAILIAILFCLQAFPSLALDIAEIKVAPEVTCVKLGDAVTFKAEAYDESGNTIPDVEFNWILIGVGVIIAKTGNTATYKAQSPGSATITAVANGKSGSVSFTVGSPKVSNVKVRVDPDIAGEVADYFITFETDICGILEPGDKIYIAFPKDTVFPKYYQCNVLTVNGIPASFEVSSDEDHSPVLIITVPDGFQAVTYVYVRICKVINPRGGACYLIAVATSKQPHWSISNPFAIRGSIITPPDVTVKPNIVGEIAEYTIKFKTSSSGRLSSCYGGFIFIEFPYSTGVPQEIALEAVTVNGISCTSAKPSVNGRVVKIYPGMVVLEDSEVVVKFSLEAGIRNPEKPDDYTLTVWTSSDTIHVDSRPYRIIASKIEDLAVTVDKPYINTPSAYTIKFKTGLVGKLNIGAQITVYFPQTTTLPQSSRAGDIIVNNIPTIKPTLIEGSYTLVIFVPCEILAKSEVTILVPEDFGVINPPDPRRYKIEVHTAKEGTNVSSNEYMIGPSVIGELNVSLSLPYIGVCSDIDLSFKTGGGGRLSKEKDRIFVVFPKGTYLPNYIDKNDVTIQGVPLIINPFIKKENFEVILNVPQDISANTRINVHFSKNSNILNPKVPGEYLFSVATSREVSYLKSPIVRITESTLKDVKLELFSDTVFEKSNFLLSFYTGEAGALTKRDRINVYFGKDFKIPSSYEGGIMFNGEELPVFNVLYDPSLLKVQIELSKNLLPDEMIKLNFTEGAGIENPITPGYYNIGVSTNKETKIVATSDFRIITLPVTTIIINPSTPDGENGWYITEPEISFRVSSENRQRVKTFYSFDGEDFVEYINPLTISSGIHEIYFYSSHSKYAKEEIKEYRIKVDTIFPIIQLDEPKIWTNKPEFMLSFAVIELNLSEVKVQNKVLDVSSGRVNAVLKLTEGENKISISAVDLAGNSSHKEIIIVLDTVSPFIEIIKPLPWSRSIRKDIRIEGRTDSDAIISFDRKPISNENGKFSLYYSLSPGLNNLAFIAMDFAGNSKSYHLPVTYYFNFSVKLVIGTKFAETSFGNVEFDAPPYIKKGYTFVPLRFFVELLDCEVSFEPIFQIITISDPYYGTRIVMQIGNKTVTVNEEKKILEAPPEIRSGRTFVPLRFIAEEFNFKVNYVKKENTVIMIYNGD